MSALIVVGTQWGDEGKGKVIDILSENADLIVRYQGGNNAGHSVFVGKEEFIFHLIPSGILRPGKICVIGSGVVIDLESLIQEIDQIKARDISFDNRFFLSERAHITMPYHRVLDKAIDERRGKGRIGTTGRGIGTTYMDKTARIGIRICDLLDKETLSKKIEIALEEKSDLLKKLDNSHKLDFEAILENCLSYADRIKAYICNTSALVSEAISKGKNVLFEGAQGTFLDVDFGTYPYVTSSHPIAGGVCTGVGIGPTKIDKVIGVVKAYTTRVGEGPFPTELAEEDADRLRNAGPVGEYGRTTGRPRRVGWFDAVLVKEAVRLSGIEEIAITRLDILDGLPKIKICTGYRYNGKFLDSPPPLAKVLEQCSPVYEEMEGWLVPTSQIREFGKLPSKARAYVKRLSCLAGAEIALISTGPAREQVIALKDIWRR